MDRERDTIEIPALAVSIGVFIIVAVIAALIALVLWPASTRDCVMHWEVSEATGDTPVCRPREAGQ